MNDLNKAKILEDAAEKLKKGLFQEGLLLLKNKRFYFFFQNNSTLYKNRYFFLYGALLTYSGNYKNSLSYLKKALLSIHISEKSEIYYLLIYSFLNLDNFEMVKYYFSKLINRPSASSFFILLSYYLCIKRKIELNISIESLKELLPEKQNEIMDRLTFSIYYILTNQVETGFALLSSVVNKYHDFFYYNFIYLKLLFKLKMYEETVEYFNINGKFLSSIESLLLYSCVLYKIGLYDQCSKILNEILFIQNNNIKAIINLGKIQNIKNNHTRAIALFKGALKKNVFYNDAVSFYLSLSYQHLGLLNNVIGVIQNISKDSTYYHKSLFNLFLLYYDLEKYNEAKKVFSEIDENKIGIKLYNKWKMLIDNKKEHSVKLNFIKALISLTPILLIIISIIFFILFYLHKGHF